MNRSSLSVVSVTGVKTDVKEGAAVTVKAVIKTGNKETLNSSYNTTVIATSEDLVWLKAEPGTCFIVKK